MQDVVPGFVHVDHPVFASRHDGEFEGSRRPVLIAGGGPVGLATALSLARDGVPSLVIEADRTVCVGSRAICLSRRTLEIVDRLGALDGFVGKGLPWTGGRSFYGAREVLHFTMPHDEDQRLAPMTNLQQYHIEQQLLDAAQERSDLIEIRWGTRVAGIRPGPEEVEVHIEADDGSAYRVAARFVVACDGARSRIRQALDLRLSGTAYEGQYVIVDIECDIDLPTERLAWFDPPSNPGRTMLMHKQPDDIWRLDYQLQPGEDPHAMIRPESVTPIVEAHLAMMGVDKPWRLIWTSTYRAAAVSLDHYRLGRVLFAGDAAHLVPIFGVRGLNGGFDDAFNLGWKLARVVGGYAPDSLLDSYSQERRHAWEVNVASAMKSTEFMAPPSRGFELMRDAVLSLAHVRPELAALINPRQSSAITYEGSPLNTVTRDEGLFRTGPRPGAAAVECPLVVRGSRRYLTEMLGDGFTLMLCGDVVSGPTEDELEAAADIGGLTLLSVGASAGPHGGGIVRERVEDPDRRVRDLYDTDPGAAYLFRPDGHVCARWRQVQEGDIVAALRRALGHLSADPS